MKAFIKVFKYRHLKLIVNSQLKRLNCSLIANRFINKDQFCRMPVSIEDELVFENGLWKSPNDKKEYKQLVLENGLNVFIISDKRNYEIGYDMDETEITGTSGEESSSDDDDEEDDKDDVGPSSELSSNISMELNENFFRKKRKICSCSIDR